MMINEEDWIKGTHSTYGDDPREHDEDEPDFTEEDVELTMCLEYLDEHNMMEDFLIWVNKNYK
jgi:hypothetical protein